ncbi:MAG: hypothetical protein IJJ33_17655 [Victivallales bacterium]|nr:hypothetical protein [Victivallales bacterium]
MPKIDALMKMMFESDEAVADVFNAVFGGGRRLIEPSMVRPAPEHEVSLRRQDDGKWTSRERICDVVRRIQWDNANPDRHFLLGIENQEAPHILMPWRVMEMQCMEYGRQLRGAHRKFHDGHPMDREEFLSAVSRDYRFSRMVTVVILWGTGPWDAPTQFADLLGASPFPELLPFEPRLEYPILIPSEISEEIMDGMEKFLKIALQYVRASVNRERMEDFLKEHPECQDLPRDFAQGLLDLLGCMHQVDSTKETVNMCKAIDDMKRESEMKGMEQGMKEGMKEGGEEMARRLVRFMREKALPEAMLQEFLVQQNFSPEQIAKLSAAY